MEKNNAKNESLQDRMNEHENAVRTATALGWRSAYADLKELREH